MGATVSTPAASLYSGRGLSVQPPRFEIRHRLLACGRRKPGSKSRTQMRLLQYARLMARSECLRRHHPSDARPPFGARYRRGNHSSEFWLLKPPRPVVASRPCISASCDRLRLSSSSARLSLASHVRKMLSQPFLQPICKFPPRGLPGNVVLQYIEQD